MNLEPEPESSPEWQMLAAARRRALAAAPLTDDSAPFGFAQRIAARAMELRRNENIACWTRWSMRAAACAGFAATIVALIHSGSSSDAPLLSPPALEIPGLSSL